MGTLKPRRCLLITLIALTWPLALMHADADPGRGQGRPGEKLAITRDSATGKVSVSWSGRGTLKQASDFDGRFKPVRQKGGTYVIEPTEEGAAFLVESSENQVISVNVVGYVNVKLPPGLSLIANPLLYPTNTVEFWWPEAPDGAQVLKWVHGVGYEVSTFDALAGAWSNPDFDISMGQGFFFRNTSSETLNQTFVGEVMQGTLVNPLPAGLSLEGALVPQSGSINTLHRIPGQPGDAIQFYVNDGLGGGAYISSIYSEQDGWVPDLILGVAEGFWIQKQQPQNWVRDFWVN